VADGASTNASASDSVSDGAVIFRIRVLIDTVPRFVCYPRSARIAYMRCFIRPAAARAALASGPDRARAGQIARVGQGRDDWQASSGGDAPDLRIARSARHHSGLSTKVSDGYIAQSRWALSRRSPTA
jgi:hypothetical protein